MSVYFQAAVCNFSIKYHLSQVFLGFKMKKMVLESKSLQPLLSCFQLFLLNFQKTIFFLFFFWGGGWGGGVITPLLLTLLYTKSCQIQLSYFN